MDFQKVFRWLFGFETQELREQIYALSKIQQLNEQKIAEDVIAIISYENTIKELQEELKKPKEEIQDPNEKYWNEKYPTSIVKHPCRKVIGKEGVTFKVDVRYFFMNNNVSELRNIVYPTTTYTTADEKMLFCQKWVKDNISYVSDEILYGVSEYWADCLETIRAKRGDCDDGAILMANLAMVAGVPYWRIRLTGGEVKGGGHAYLTYLPDSELEKPFAEQDWKVCDWCYYPNIKPFEERPNYKDEEDYYSDEVWFSFNSKFAFQDKGTALISEVK